MVYAYPPQVRKFEIIGGLFGEPYRLARCGVNDLEVPAGAEIIIEGEILANVHEPEGPFGEFTGYASYRSTQNVFVAHRDPHAPRRHAAQRHLGHVAGPHPGVLHHPRGRDPQRAPAQPAERARGARPAHDLRRVHGVRFHEEDRRRRAADGDHGHARHRALHQICDRGGRRRRHLQHQRRDVGGRDARAGGEGHHIHPGREGCDPRPYVGPADLHPDQDGHRCHPPNRTRFRGAPRPSPTISGRARAPSSRPPA